MSGRVALVVFGLALEAIGLALVSAEDLGWSRIRAFGRSFGHALVDLLRWLMRRPRGSRGRVHVSDTLTMRDLNQQILRLRSDADTDQTLAFLLAETEKTQIRLNELERRIEAEHVTRVNRLNELRQEMDDAITAGVESSKARFVRLRRLGICFLWAGGGLLAAANLV